MWRHFIRYGLNRQDFDSLPPSDLANLAACRNVFRRLRPEWRTVVSIYYAKPDQTGQTIPQYCQQNAMTSATVWKIIRSVQRLVAEERGLIEVRYGDDDGSRTT